ncbi:MAG: DUF4442 domain-containing protein [Planctomycetota bacterium]
MIHDRTSAPTIRWLLNIWPPFLFQGVRVRSLDSDFRSAKVDVKSTILTRNIMGTTFGGAMMAAADPFLPILYWRSLVSEGHSLNVWLRSMEADFLIPADQDVRLHFVVTPQQLDKAREGILGAGRVDLVDVVEAVLSSGEVAARFRVISSLRNRSSGSSPLTGS